MLTLTWPLCVLFFVPLMLARVPPPGESVVDAATARAVIGTLLDDALTRGGQVSLSALERGGEVEITVRNSDRDAESLLADPAYEPAAPQPDAPSATAGLQLAALLCEASSSSLAGGVAGPEAHFVVRFPLVS